MLIIISGLPGTGKTSVAKEIAQEVDAVVLSTDELRKRVLKELGYTERKKKRVYEEMFRIAEDQLKKKKNIILDGTFFHKELREKAFSLGKKEKECVFLIKTECPEKVVKKRIQKRYKNRKDYSEANYRVYKIIQSKFQPLRKKHFVVNTKNKKEWKKKTLDLANRMKVMETHEQIIDKIRKKKRMRLLQTHISWVLLNGKYAYKIKKPVRFSFVDYSTLESRRHFCKEELRINSMLSPEIYLAVVPIKKSDDSITFNGKGKIVEYAVKMVQLPQQHRMDHLLKKNKISAHHIVDIAEILNNFHAKTQEAPQKYGSPQIIRENFSPAFKTKGIVEKHLHSGEKMEGIESKVEAFLNKNDALFKKRIKEKRIRHCHGDVRTKNIFIHKKRVYIFDAIEFSEKISCCDVAAEIAFLAMDLHFHNRKQFAEVLVEKYIHFSRDNRIRKLIEFYQCYRALVETLVESYILEDEEISKEEKEKSKRACQKYLDLAAFFAKKL